MSNSFYNASGYPATRSAGTSINARNEFAAVAAGFEKMPVLTALALVRVNAAGTALESFADPYLTAAAAASTYLTSAAAASTYLTSAAAASTYLTPAAAAAAYLTPAAAASAYLLKTGGPLTGPLTGAITSSVATTGIFIGTLSGLPSVGLTYTGAAVDNKYWDQYIDTTMLHFRVVNDAISAAQDWLQVTRAGVVISTVQFPQGKVIVGSGAVGIGGVATLTVRNGTTAVFQSLVASGGEEWLAGASASSTYTGAFSNTPFSLRTNNTDRVFISTAGNVGIGAVSGGARLDVVGSASSDVYQRVTDGTIQFFSQARTTGGAVGATGTLSTHPLAFHVNAVERARITTAGDFLVGTAASQYSAAGRGDLEVNGTGSAIAALKIADVAQMYLFADGAAAYVNTAVAIPLLLQTSNITRMTISAAGEIIANGIAIVRSKAATTSRASNATLSDDPDLVLPLTAGRYAIEGWINPTVASLASQGFKYSFNFTGTATSGSAGSNGVMNNTLFTGQTVALATSQGFNAVQTAGDWLYVSGNIIVTGAGNLSLQWAQFASNASATNLVAGSWLKCTKVG